MRVINTNIQARRRCQQLQTYDGMAAKIKYADRLLSSIAFLQLAIEPMKSGIVKV